MGKKQSWCTKEGCKARQTGMKREKKSRKILIAIFFSVCAVIYVTLGGIFAERSGNAMRINGDYAPSEMEKNAEIISQESFANCV